MAVNSSRFKRNTINTISHFGFDNKLKFVVHNAIFLNCKLFILCPMLKLIQQHLYLEHNFGGTVLKF